jgi:hypothetical protein
MNKSPIAALILSGKMKPKENSDGDDNGLESAAEELIEAIHSNDAAGVAEALKSAFEILDSGPHEEGEHE